MTEWNWVELTSGPERYDESKQGVFNDDPIVGWVRRFASRRADGTYSFSDPTWYIDLEGPGAPLITMAAAFLWCRDPWNPDKTTIAEHDDEMHDEQWWEPDYTWLPATEEMLHQLASEFDPNELTEHWSEPGSIPFAPEPPPRLTGDDRAVIVQAVTKRLAAESPRLTGENISDVLRIASGVLAQERRLGTARLYDLEHTRKRITWLSNTRGRRPVSAAQVDAVITAVTTALKDHGILTVTDDDIRETAIAFQHASLSRIRIDLN